MCSAQSLLHAAARMQHTGKFSRNDAKRVQAIARQMQQGTASPHDIAWAKRIAGKLMDRPPTQPAG